MEYIERELANENEKSLCSNEKCASREDGKRKKIGFNMEIIQAGAERFCVRGSAPRNTACNEGARPLVASVHASATVCAHPARKLELSNEMGRSPSSSCR
jgi:hypothetical protein